MVRDGGRRAFSRCTWLLFACVVLFTVGGLTPRAAGAEEELAPPRYLSVVDEGGRHICTTGHVLRSGDEILAWDNRRYRVLRVQDGRAVARLIGEEDLQSLLTPQDQEAISRWLASPGPGAPRAGPAGSPWGSTAWGRGRPAPSVAALPAQKAHRVVGIYHTHSDET